MIRNGGRPLGTRRNLIRGTVALIRPIATGVYRSSWDDDINMLLRDFYAAYGIGQNLVT